MELLRLLWITLISAVLHWPHFSHLLPIALVYLRLSVQKVSSSQWQCLLLLLDNSLFVKLSWLEQSLWFSSPHPDSNTVSDFFMSRVSIATSSAATVLWQLNSTHTTPGQFPWGTQDLQGESAAIISLLPHSCSTLTRLTCFLWSYWPEASSLCLLFTQHFNYQVDP